ncbi:YbaY family lipoprotein [Deinococcus sp. 14RED07]|uniref:YbaY family lipoprotein n=1 Tax=Deinococcus sp. 14RED07 TaxID=2745874 RepID=UPI001E5ED791|nr:YbaY family lipoprotein [Deinococcus sp. 14RED07]MCD0176166.1 YbaY family lipoprotein [Deinococcus sp. 14RED07]
MNFFTLTTRSLPGLLLACALNAAPAGAQIILTPVTPPTTPPPTTPRSTTPDPAPRADLPAGWREVRGTLRPDPARPLPTLPPGTQATLTIRDSVRPDTPLVRVSFPVRRLPTPYWLNFNPSRLQSGRRYTVQAVLTDAAGTTLWRAQAPLPTTTRALLPLTPQPTTP